MITRPTINDLEDILKFDQQNMKADEAKALILAIKTFIKSKMHKVKEAEKQESAYPDVAFSVSGKDFVTLKYNKHTKEGVVVNIERFDQDIHGNTMAVYHAVNNLRIAALESLKKLKGE